MMHSRAKIKNQRVNWEHFRCWLRIYVPYAEQYEDYEKPMRSGNISQDRKQENNGEINLRKLEGIPEKIW